MASDFETKTKETLKAKGKKTVVYCYAPKELKWANDAVDRDIAKNVAWQLGRGDVSVVDPDRVAEWLGKHDKSKKTSEIGKAFLADYVVQIDLRDYTLYEPNESAVYRGRADCIVKVVKMDDDQRDGHVIYSQALKSQFPSRAPVDANQMSFAEFKKQYLAALGKEIGALFVGEREE